MTRHSGTMASLSRVFAACSAAVVAPPAAAEPVTLPILIPAPVAIEATGGAILVGRSAVVIEGPGTDPDMSALVRQILTMAGVESIETARRLPAVIDRLHVVIGIGDTGVVHAALARSAANIADKCEGYTIASMIAGNSGVVTLAGHDSDGLFHALQTFRQLAIRGSIPGMVPQDYPTMLIRGTIEGFMACPGRRRIVPTT